MMKILSYMYLTKQEKGEMPPAQLTRPLDRHTVENLSYAAADMYYKNKQKVCYLMPTSKVV